jgi:hypothetical protein
MFPGEAAQRGMEVERAFLPRFHTFDEKEDLIGSGSDDSLV